MKYVLYSILLVTVGFGGYYYGSYQQRITDEVIIEKQQTEQEQHDSLTKTANEVAKEIH